MLATRTDSGYQACACRDCFEIAIGEAGSAVCSECVDADCDLGESECDAPHAYSQHCGDTECCGLPCECETGATWVPTFCNFAHCAECFATVDPMHECSWNGTEHPSLGPSASLPGNVAVAPEAR